MSIWRSADLLQFYFTKFYLDYYESNLCFFNEIDDERKREIWYEICPPSLKVYKNIFKNAKATKKNMAKTEWNIHINYLSVWVFMLMHVNEYSPRSPLPTPFFSSTTLPSLWKISGYAHDMSFTFHRVNETVTSFENFQYFDY